MCPTSIPTLFTGGMLSNILNAAMRSPFYCKERSCRLRVRPGSLPPLVFEIDPTENARIGPRLLKSIPKGGNQKIKQSSRSLFEPVSGLVQYYDRFRLVSTFIRHFQVNISVEFRLHECLFSMQIEWFISLSTATAATIRVDGGTGVGVNTSKCCSLRLPSG